MTGWFLERIAAFGAREALIDGDARASYAEIADLARHWGARLDAEGVAPGAVVIARGDYCAETAALILALAARGCIATPLAEASDERIARCAAIAGAEAVISPGAPDTAEVEARAPGAPHPLTARLRASGRAGLILFSSGSTGEPKACLLDLDALLEKAARARRGWRALVFLLIDHIGGINTLLSSFAAGGTAIVIRDRRPDTVARAIEAERAELLPASPTFLKMLLMSGPAQARDLSSLELITYGTEAMPPATLQALASAFPKVRLKQTYGLSEIGIVPTRSRGDGSLWMQVGGDEVETRIDDGILKLRAPTAMLGYLNAPSPFDADGWLDTRDRVETDGDWLRIVGRESELINVGGEKVHPVEIEDVLLQAGNIADATVTGRANPVTGAVVIASVVLVEPEEPRALKARLAAFCAERLEEWKRPMSIRIADAPLHSPRFKKLRAA